MDLLLCLVDAELYEPVWSERIMGEVRERLPLQFMPASHGMPAEKFGGLGAFHDGAEDDGRGVG